MAKKIIIEKEKLPKILYEIGCSQWKNFKVGELIKTGNAYRCTLKVDKKESMLDFYFNKNGTTTVVSVGKNKEI